MSTAGSTSLEQLVALNDEIASLARAGVPLERGLIELGADLPGRLGRLASELGRRLESGESLAGVVSEDDGSFPPLYGAIVRAGLRSGRLPAALQELSSSVRRVAELRRLVGASILYPLLLLGLAYALFVFTTVFWLPVIIDSSQGMGSFAAPWLVTLVSIGRHAMWWAPWLPIVGVAWLFAVWYRSGRVRWATASRRASRLPWLGRLLQAGRMAAFAELLALLVRHDVPLDEALILSAEGSGDGHLQKCVRQIADSIQRGGTSASSDDVPRGFPPLLAWLLTTRAQQNELAAALRHQADAYRQKAQRLADWLTMYLPILLAVGIGGTAALVLGASLLGPWFYLLYELARSL